MELLNILIHLAKKGALYRPVAIKTSQVGKELDISQQSVSRWLISLEKRNYTTRKTGIRGYLVQITPAGRRFMLEMRNRLSDALTESDKLIIKGRVFTGMQEGRYYIGKKGYGNKIKSMMGFLPFAGTLNLRLITMDDRGYKEKLASTRGMVIPRFEDEGRTFGSLKCFPCTIKGNECGVVIPERSHYGSDTLEIVAPDDLREKLKLRDGDDVQVEVKLGYEEL
ncbi:MAG: CTP-dependent riboflavin kinase [Candidatus Aenigmatarchaeota archaeon]|nr:MAG: CTP-dependent riboflavin kinase [Candidatus Aenigmarchaeota archaeon]